MPATRRLIQALAMLMVLAACHGAQAQELEPRRWSHLPVGINFAALAYAYTDGNIFLDPAVLVEDAQAEIHTRGSRLRPHFRAVRQGRARGRGSRRSRTAIGKGRSPASSRRPAARASAIRGSGWPSIFFGSPAQTTAEFAGYQTNTIVGTALEVTVPIGEYFEDRLVNLGSNRWVFRPMAGIVHTRGKWTYEATASAWFFGDNDDYQAGRMLEQDPLYAHRAAFHPYLSPGLVGFRQCRLRYRRAGDRGGRAQPVRPGQHAMGTERRFPDRPPAGHQGGIPDWPYQRKIGVDYERVITRVLAHVGWFVEPEFRKCAGSYCS